MRTYKKLKSRKKATDKRSTIREMHETQMKEFEDYYNSLPQKKKELLKIKEEFKIFKENDSIQKQNRSNGKSDYYYQKTITDLEKEIYNMENQTDMLDYISNVQHVFLKINQDSRKGNEDDAYEGVGRDDDSQYDISPKLKDKINNGIKKYIQITQKSNRGNLVDEYINAMNGLSENDLKSGQPPDLFNCDNCGEDLHSNTTVSLLVCTKCGLTKEWQDPDLPQWSDEVDFSKTYRYKKLGYFIEHLYRMQAQECTVIPDFVINNVMMKLREKRIKSNDKIDKKTIKTILKELDMTTYYDNINSIIRTISGKQAPKFPEDLEDKLICMFMRTLEPFEKYKSLIPSRNNYLSYPYAIRKLLEIISHEENNSEVLEFKQYFGLLKSRNKTWEHERVWKKICEENSWPFIPSI